ncbi:MAG: hypothetical protein JWP75_3913 [Frondihabitans sp.]|nr:hypothetical protein [Frondihabitans sp.]
MSRPYAGSMEADPNIMNSGSDTSARFAAFAAAAEEGGSPLYAAWAAALAADPDLLAIVDRARPSQRQPVLVLAVCRLLGAPLSPVDGLGGWIRGHADVLVAELDRRFTQTNDVRRVAPVAVALSRIPGSVALLEVGASAGLGLYPDRYDIRVTEPSTNDATPPRVLGSRDSRVRIDLRVESGDLLEPAAALPEIVWRRGLDIEPLDVRDDDDMLWLATLLWPGQDDRVELLCGAVAVARQDPAPVVRGDAVDGLVALADSAPLEATLVVVSSGTLVYLPGARRQAFVDAVGSLGARWISYERTGLLTGIQATLPDPEGSRPLFATLALDGVALASGDAHGTVLRAF